MENLQEKFDQAFKNASKTSIMLPQDIMLQFYAYYKQATMGSDYRIPSNANKENVRDAFKLNAWFQLSHLTKDEAKIEYIKLVDKYIKDK